VSSREKRGFWEIASERIAYERESVCGKEVGQGERTREEKRVQGEWTVWTVRLAGRMDEPYSGLLLWLRCFGTTCRGRWRSRSLVTLRLRLRE